MPEFRKPFRAPPLRRKPDNVAQFQARPRRRRQRGRGGWLPALGLVGAGLALGGAGGLWLANGGAWPAFERASAPITAAAPAPQDTETASFSTCSGPVRINCVVDGDTFWYHGEKIRIADINTPEISEPGCPAEARLGNQATRRLHALLNAGAFSLEQVDRDRDTHGRLLRIVTRGGQSLGAVLVSEGLAEEWQGYKRDWC